MGFEIGFSPQSLSDLEAIVREIAKDDPARAESFGMELVEKTDVLAALPLTGGKTREFDDESIRELQHKPYRIIYRIQNSKGRIVILRFWHTSRGFPSLKMKPPFFES